MHLIEIDLVHHLSVGFTTLPLSPTRHPGYRIRVDVMEESVTERITLS